MLCAVFSIIEVKRCRSDKFLVTYGDIFEYEVTATFTLSYLTSVLYKYVLFRCMRRKARMLVSLQRIQYYVIFSVYEYSYCSEPIRTSRRIFVSNCSFNLYHL